MKRFHGKYDSIQKLKEQSKRLAEQKQSAAKQRLDSAKADLHVLERRLDQQAEVMADQVGGTQPAGNYLNQQNILKALQRQIVEARQRVTEFEAAFRQAAQERADLATQVEALDTLRESQWKEHRRAAQHANQVELDDSAMHRWIAAANASNEE